MSANFSALIKNSYKYYYKYSYLRDASNKIKVIITMHKVITNVIVVTTIKIEISTVIFSYYAIIVGPFFQRALPRTEEQTKSEFSSNVALIN